MKNILTILLLLAFNISCLESESYNEYSKKGLGLYNLSFKEMDKVSRKHKLSTIGRGLAAADQIHEILRAYYRRIKTSTSEAIDMLLEILNASIRDLNAKESKQQRPFYEKYPFLVENLVISITFYESGYDTQLYPNPSSIRINNGIVHIDYRLENKERFEESYSLDEIKKYNAGENP